MIKKISHLCTILILCIQFLFLGQLRAEPYESIEGQSVKVFFPPGMKGTAREVASLFPLIQQELEAFFSWNLNRAPIVLIDNSQRRAVPDTPADLVVGYAVPARNLIVIFYSRTSSSPRNLRVVLKHELCHIMLHQHVTRVHVPRWLDEGIAQVASGTAGEMAIGREPDVLRLSRSVGGFIRLRSLGRDFPSRPQSLLLAYAESKEFVKYLVEEFGQDTLRSVLQAMEDGSTAEEAFLVVTGMSLDELEAKWRRSLEQKDTWLARLSYYLYEILFGLSAVVCVYAFIRQIRARKAYREEEKE